ncbi:MAG: SDR family NAD(P)-dependent oxidoreductase [Bacteroidota bacterium]
MKTRKNYTIVTGASMGLGKEMAIESARRGHNLILIALPGPELQQVCNELESKYGVSAVARECDLTDEHALDKLVREILSNFSVDQLINNAGIGGPSRFEESEPEYLDRIIHLNIRATTMLCRMLVPELKKHKKALILNVASIAAFSPMPYKSIYPASKAFIYSFSRSLSQELRESGVRVVVLTPGPIMTNPDVVRRIIRQGALARIGILTARKISRLALDGAERGKKVIVPGIMSRINRFLFRWVPESWRMNLMARVLHKELKPI